MRKRIISQLHNSCIVPLELLHRHAPLQVSQAVQVSYAIDYGKHTSQQEDVGAELGQSCCGHAIHLSKNLGLPSI